MNVTQARRLGAGCRPQFSLAPYRELYSVCDCGALLTSEPTSDTINEYTVVDESGCRYIDRAPALLRTDPARWWAELAERNVAEYSRLSAAVRLGHHTWIHTHRAARQAEGPQPLYPWCHEQPMQATPRGWVCRAYRTVFPYEES